MSNNRLAGSDPFRSSGKTPAQNEVGKNNITKATDTINKIPTADSINQLKNLTSIYNRDIKQFTGNTKQHKKLKNILTKIIKDNDKTQKTFNKFAVLLDKFKNKTRKYKEYTQQLENKNATETSTFKKIMREIFTAFNIKILFFNDRNKLLNLSHQLKKQIETTNTLTQKLNVIMNIELAQSLPKDFQENITEILNYKSYAELLLEPITKQLLTDNSTDTQKQEINDTLNILMKAEPPTNIAIKLYVLTQLQLSAENNTDDFYPAQLAADFYSTFKDNYIDDLEPYLSIKDKEAFEHTGITDIERIISDLNNNTKQISTTNLADMLLNNEQKKYLFNDYQENYENNSSIQIELSDFNNSVNTDTTASLSSLIDNDNQDLINKQVKKNIFENLDTTDIAKFYAGDISVLNNLPEFQDLNQQQKNKLTVILKKLISFK